MQGDEGAICYPVVPRGWKENTFQKASSMTLKLDRALIWASVNLS